MRWYGRSGPRWLLAGVLALGASIGVYYWIHSLKNVGPQRGQPIRLSDVEGQSIRIPSLPSIQMHLIPRAQPTPLSPVHNCNETERSSSSSSIGH